MRKIDWKRPLSDEDIVWLRQSGMPDTEGIIERHQSQFAADVPPVEVPDDEVSRSALDAQARLADRVEAIGNGAPVEVDPTQTGDEAIENIEGDDYETWTKDDLEAEVTARNGLPETGDVEVVGTGKDGNVLKADIVKGLRLWDQEYPNAL